MIIKTQNHFLQFFLSQSPFPARCTHNSSTIINAKPIPAPTIKYRIGFNISSRIYCIKCINFPVIPEPFPFAISNHILFITIPPLQVHLILQNILNIKNYKVKKAKHSSENLKNLNFYRTFYNKSFPSIFLFDIKSQHKST